MTEIYATMNYYDFRNSSIHTADSLHMHDEFTLENEMGTLHYGEQSA